MFGSSDQDDRKLYELIRMGDHTDQIVVDPETAIESFFASIGALGLITLCIATPALMFLKHSDLAWKIAPFGLMFSVAGLVLSRLTEVNYRLDLRDHSVTLYRRFAGLERSTPVCDFSEIALVTGVSKSWRRSTGNNNYVWETRYGIVLVLRSGKVLRVISPDLVSRSAVDQHGERLASLLGVTWRGEFGTVKARGAGQGLCVTHTPHSRSNLSCMDRIGVGCMAVVLAFVGVAWLAKTLGFDPAKQHQVAGDPSPASMSRSDLIPMFNPDFKKTEKGTLYEITVYNNGDGPSTAPFEVILKVDGQRVLTRTVSEPIEALEGHQIEVTLKSGRKLRAIVDSKNVVKETDEQNNKDEIALARAR